MLRPHSLLLAALLALASAPGRAENPWLAFDELRAALKAKSPLSAKFEQTFTPAGFDEGDLEQGTLAISLPQCLRWDYGEPFPKIFLLCDDKIHTWAPGDTVGSRYLLQDEDAPGLDFFLQTSSELRAKYNASAVDLPDGKLKVELIPHQPTDDVTRVEVVLDTKTNLLVSLLYDDVEENRTVFAISNYESGAERGVFLPPPDMQWEDP